MLPAIEVDVPFIVQPPLIEADALASSVQFATIQFFGCDPNSFNKLILNVHHRQCCFPFSRLDHAPLGDLASAEVGIYLVHMTLLNLQLH